MLECLHEICLYIGLLYVISSVVHALPKLLLWEKNHFERYGGGWAIITGATDGIGLGYCEELAKRKFNIVMVSRNPDKLQRTAKELEASNPGVQVRTVVADFQRSFEEGFFERIVQEVADLDVSVLVNNIGTLIDIMPFTEHPPEELSREMNLNLPAMAMMTRLLLPKMLSRKHRSAIITLSSFTTYANFYGGSNYCACKLYNDIFSRSLQYEHNNKIDFLSVKPGLVTTPLTRNTTSMFHVDKNQCVKGSLRSLGHIRDTCGHWSHDIHGLCFELMPNWVGDMI